MRMLSTEYSPLRTLSPDRWGDVFDDFDRMFNSWVTPTLNTSQFQPSCDIRETEGHWLVDLDMPGVKKEDIKIEVNGNQLTISGERHHERMDDKAQADQKNGQREQSYVRYQRSFTLPTSVDSEKIEAQYENGVLSVALPKAETAKPRTIPVQGAREGFFSRLLGTKKEEPKTVNDVRVS